MFKDNLGYTTSFKYKNKDEEMNLHTGQEKTQITTTEDSNEAFSCKLVWGLAQTLDYVPGQ